VSQLDDYLPYVVLAEVLADGDASRLERRLVQRDRIATHLSAYLGFMGDPFDVRGPTALLFQVHHPSDVGADRLLSTVDEELDRLANDGLGDGELRRVTARTATQLLREVDPVLGRTLSMAALEQQHGRAELLNELPGRLAAVSEEQVRQAAATLRPHRRACVELVPGSAR
jgi:Predicted Zn-dependent peptidases